ncbi:MAG: 16S rRNA (cytidine1402-2'-O)-methyltransferase [Candidatus Saganbacteria bacterium]|uniref:Ribosomal RNA small subunit methyltransferase I n=1 Tax=Candidatus Saganbacteria bacterium TaxID=2575572 RepID=A0A833L278_UNCSA|nr:MAG: 16S rRNA (cytidine1402-2'-O)-methyltransferase [Candidatus Saganbacteria bacterium]
MSELFVVATPIGNLEDITYRAIRILSEVDLIAAEDTRQTKKLLDRYSIKTPMTSYHKFNIKSKTDYLVEMIKNGKKIALVSDSGMPGISDPGYELVKSAINNNIKVIPIPGASALVSALAVSGLPTDKFIFLGFLQKKPGKRRKALKEIENFDGTAIIYESPYRVVKCLEDIFSVLGDRQVVIARELTKIYEEVLRGKVSELIKARSVYKGEVVILVNGKSMSVAQSGEM